MRQNAAGEEEAMTRLDVLRSQAEVLRRLAESFDVPDLRRDALAIAARCEEMASTLMREEAERQGAPASEDRMASSREPTPA
jgi:hypothetical protein